MKKNIRKALAAIMIMILGIGLGGCAKTTADKTPVKLPEVKIAASQGAGSYPLAPMAENNALQSIADKTTIESWVTNEQLSAMVTSNQVQFIMAPMTNAIMLYNKGASVKLANVAVWGMLYVLSADNSVKSLADLKGKQIAVTGGSTGYHGTVFRHILIKNGIDPDKDLTILNMDMAESSSKLATGEIKLALSNEPNSSVAIANAAKGNVTVIRAIDLQVEWGKATGSKARIPQAGLIVVGENAGNTALVNEVLKQFDANAKWINENPAAAGPVVEKYFPKMKAGAVEKSLPFARLEPVSSPQCKDEVNVFLTEYLKTAPPASIGGKIPDDNFYYSGN
ncbi:MAG: ABC transporter substrate-binding protein [Syntrophomonadaceae bacterium]